MADRVERALTCEVRSAVEHGKSKNQKPYVKFESIVDSEMAGVMIWGRALQFLPKTGLTTGHVIVGKGVEVDAYKNTRQFWFNSIDQVHEGMPQVVPETAPAVPAGSGGPVSSPAGSSRVPPTESFTSSALTFRQALKFVSVGLAQVAALTRALFPAATDDAHLEAVQAIVVSMFIALGQGKMKVRLAGDDEGPQVLDVSQMLRDLASKMSVGVRPQ